MKNEILSEEMLNFEQMEEISGGIPDWLKSLASSVTNLFLPDGLTVDKMEKDLENPAKR